MPIPPNMVINVAFYVWRMCITSFVIKFNLWRGVTRELPSLYFFKHTKKHAYMYITAGNTNDNTWQRMVNFQNNTNEVVRMSY